MVKLEKIKVSSFFSFFYLITGIALLITLVQSNFALHVGLLGALSLISSYGLNEMKRWAILITTLTSLSGIAFGCVTIYVIYQRLLFNLGWPELVLFPAMILYVALLAVSFFYVTLKREKFR